MPIIAQSDFHFERKYCLISKLRSPDPQNSVLPLNNLQVFEDGLSLANTLEANPMAGIAQNPQADFWQRPVEFPIPSLVGFKRALPNSCATCKSEFLVGARFCHSCGAARQATSAETELAGGISGSSNKPLAQLGLTFGLSGAPLIAFAVGLLCLVAALLVGILHPTYDALDFQALQWWRLQWLISALAAFAAGILLKRL